MSNKGSEISYKDGAYQILVDDMTCQHCVKAVEKAVLAVADVSAAMVDLSAGLVEVSGGLPHEVVEAIIDAGYSAKPKAKIPDNCPISEPVNNKTAIAEAINPPSQDKPDNYQIKIADMTCSSCVAAVEKALKSVTGVSKAQVNLVEKKAWIEGGDPKTAVEAVIDQGYEATLIESSAPTDKQSYQINITDMTCTSCVATVEKAILAVAGVSKVQVNLVAKKAYVTGGAPDTVVNAIIDQGYGADFSQEAVIEDRLILLFDAKKESLAADKKLHSLLNEVAAEIVFSWPEVSLKTHLHPAKLLMQLADAGYSASYKEQFNDPHLNQAEEARKEIALAWKKAILAGSVGTLLMAGEMSGVFPELAVGKTQFFWAGIALLCLFTMWYSGRNYYNTAIKQARHHTSNMDTLVALGTSAAWLSSVIIILDPAFIPGRGNHLYLDASVLILAFLQFGHALETRAKRITSEAIGTLVQLAPKSAAVIVTDGTKEKELILPVSLLRKGDNIRIKSGETIPIDAQVISGKSNVDESMLTGEPLTVPKHPGDEIIGGTNNGSGSLVAKVIRLGEETTLSNIIHMVQQAQLSKPPIANLVDKVSAIFVPIVIIIAIMTFCVWFFFGPEPQLAFAFTAGIAVLVIACPCALGLATPIAIMMGTGRAAQLGILIKNSDALQSASHLTHIVVDKTGTLTAGKPVISAHYAMSDIDENRILQLALSLEMGSEHPLAEAIIKNAQQRDVQALQCDDFTAIVSHGISGTIEQQLYFLGNIKLMAEQGVKPDAKWQQTASEEANKGGTPIWLANKDKLLGLLILKDPIRDESSSAIKHLHDLGIQVVMCTGDHHDTANAVARSLNIDEVHSELLPEQKLAIITKLQQQGYKVGMVGDGVNDAPALAKADTGFAIGSGTDVAIENADITLVGDSLDSVSTAIKISTATLTNIKQNLLGAFIYNVIGIPLAAGVFYPLTGWLLNPMFASFAMAMSSVTVVTNANRLRFFKPEKHIK